LLQAQRFVEDEAACACKAAHLPALVPGGHQLEAKSLLDEHAVILSSRTENFKENRIDDFAVGAILPRAEPRGLPCKLINQDKALQFTGTHSLADPFWVLPAWLRHATRHGQVVRAGTVVSIGNWSGNTPVKRGDRVFVRFEGLGAAVVQL
jgi:hypothetical protein